MKRVFFLLLICVFLFGGCAGGTTSDMFALPEMPEMQKQLRETVESVLGGGFDYSEPRSGLNRQSLQLIDLDGDGEEEGVAFLRDITETYKTFIYIFERTERGFELFDIIEGSERELFTVSYANLTGDDGYEIVVEWGDDGDGSHPITVYALTGYKTSRILAIFAKQYSVSDIDGDGGNDFLAVVNENEKVFADVYTARGDEISIASHIPLSKDGGKLISIKSGKLSASRNGVFIERERDSGAVTDVITFDGERFLNLLPSGAARSTRALSADIGGDGIIKIPTETEREAPDGKMSGTYRWSTVSDKGTLKIAAFTYHDYSDGWYLSMPTSWSGSIAVKPELIRSGEVAISFMTVEKVHGDTEEVISAPLFTIYRLYGRDRAERAAEEGRFIISERDDVIFAGSIASESYLATEISEAFIKSAFKSIESEWFSEILFA